MKETLENEKNECICLEKKQEKPKRKNILQTFNHLLGKKKNDSVMVQQG